MFQNLTALGYTIIAFTILLVVGSVVVTNLGNSVGGTANTTAEYMNTQLGSSGLAGWTPAIIAVAIGVLFLAAFGFGQQRQ